MISSLIQNELQNYSLKTPREKDQALKEILQEVILSGLADTDFFDHAAFYGGTALRIFYGLDRFSEDLDFSLMKKEKSFALSKYFSAIEHQVNSLGFDFKVEQKEKAVQTEIQSAFLKGNTRQHLLLLFPQEAPGVPGNQKIETKFEIDTDPDPGAHFEEQALLFPYPVQVRLFDKPSLFAGKAAAVVNRNWGNRVKGRDLYDYLFYLQTKTKINLDYFWSQVKNNQRVPESATSIEDAKKLLNQKFASIDYENARKDVENFISNPDSLRHWSASLFQQVTDQYLDAE